MLVKHTLKFITALLVLVAVIALLSYVGPEKLVDLLVLENVYLIVFVLGIIGGVSAFSAAGFYATLFSFALGGADPFILALFSAPGVLIGDFIFWYIGIQGRQIINEEYNSYLLKFSSWLKGKPKWFTPIAVYVYTGFTPFPGDFLMLTLAVLNYKFSQIFIPTLLGNYTLALLVSVLGVYI